MYRSSPEGTVEKVAQDDSPGSVQLRPASPVGTTESCPGATGDFQPYLRDFFVLSIPTQAVVLGYIQPSLRD